MRGVYYLITLLRYTPPYYNVELYETKTNYSVLLYLNRLLHIAELYPFLMDYWGLSNVTTMLSKYQILMHWWVRPNFNTLLTYTLSYYTLSCSQSYNIVATNLVLLHWWAIPNPKTLLKYTLSFYIAELFPTLSHCWTIFCLFTMLTYSQS